MSDNPEIANRQDRPAAADMAAAAVATAELAVAHTVLRITVAAMRSAQRSYFASRAPKDLATAKKLEAQVDELLAEKPK